MKSVEVFKAFVFGILITTFVSLVLVLISFSSRSNPVLICTDELTQGDNHVVFLVRSGNTLHDSEQQYQYQQGIHVFIYNNPEHAKRAGQILLDIREKLKNLD